MTPLQLTTFKNNNAAIYTDDADLLSLEANALMTLMTLENKFEGLPPLLKDNSVIVSPNNDTSPLERAASIVDTSLQGLPAIDDAVLRGLRAVTPPALPNPTSERCLPAKEPHRSKIKARRTATNSRRSQTGSSCLLPTASDPIDASFLMSLHSARKINPVHEAVRRDVLEVRRTMSGKIFFQCGCCKHLPHNERAKLSRFAPRNVGTIYRSFTRFMMEHVSVCEHIPKNIKRMKAKRSSLRLRGVKDHWTKSAFENGLMNTGRNIVYRD